MIRLSSGRTICNGVYAMNFRSMTRLAKAALGRPGRRRVASAVALLVCGTTTAQAHDELYGWRGFYVGLQGAYSFINQDITFRVPNTNTGRADLGGLGGTILTVYRIPLGTERYRIGIEFDGTVGDNRGPFNRYRFGADFLVNLRGTLGMHLRPDLLWFGTVGVGWVGINSATISTANSVVGGQALSDRRSAKTVVGGVVGTGLEWDMGRAIHLRGDYLYGSFDDHRADTSTSAGAAIADKTISTQAHQLRLGIVVSLQNPYDEPHGRGGDIDHDRYVGGPMK